MLAFQRYEGGQRSPLAEGRELKYSSSSGSYFAIESPLAEGRELKLLCS